MIARRVAMTGILLAGRRGLREAQIGRAPEGGHVIGPDHDGLATQQHRNKGAHGQDFPKFPHVDLSRAAAKSDAHGDSNAESWRQHGRAMRNSWRSDEESTAFADIWRIRRNLR
jgi:hypothetical protein